MKKLLCLSLLLPFLASGQSQGQNYVKNITYKVDTIDPFADPDPSQAVVTVTYYDGLGRPIQKRAYRQSTSGTDVVTPITYDGFGRQPLEFLPYINHGATKDYSPDAISEQTDFYSQGDPNLTGSDFFETAAKAYSRKEFDNSPLNEILMESAPGDAWVMGNGTEVKYSHVVNLDDEVRFFMASTNTSFEPSLTDNSFYGAGALFKEITKDENWKPADGDNNTTQEFKDKLGKVVLKRHFNNDDAYDTYYVYDKFGNLTYVIPPIVDTQNMVDTNALDLYCYQYKYDHRNRQVQKKMPGRQWEYTIYDKLDRPVAVGPVLSPFNGGEEGWLITKYDRFDRVVYTGWYEEPEFNSVAIENMKSYIYGSGTIHEEKTTSATDIDGIDVFYTKQVKPNNKVLLLTVNYYDNYTFPNLAVGFPESVAGVPAIEDVTGLPTANWTRVLHLSTTPEGEFTYFLYDKKGRVLREHKVNHMGGYTRTDNIYNFEGELLTKTTTHRPNTSGIEVQTTEDFEYNKQGKLVNHFHTINNGDKQLLAHNKYDQLGNLISKDNGGNDLTTYIGWQTVNYRYNIRGWLTGINDVNQLGNDLFAFKINYNQREGSFSSEDGLYNGNISQTYWRSQSDNIKRSYNFGYDHLNRLTDATYEKPDADIPVTHAYDELLDYDKNGNITSIARNGNLDNVDMNFAIDNLSLSYWGNRLMRAHDNTNSPLGFKDEAISQGAEDVEDDYRYDDNGNMISDTNKGITDITYNHLNLPIRIIFDDNPNKKISYLYNAAGQKVQKSVSSSSTSTVNVTDYQDGFQYLNGKLSFIQTAEGYANCNQVDDVQVFRYVYNYLDHLGNIRMSYGMDKGDRLTIMEENHYYPFGLRHTNYNSDLKAYKKEDDGQLALKAAVPPGSGDEGALKALYQYKYNGMEWQDELGLAWYDYGARNYDPAIGRWMNIDPLADTHPNMTPYRYCFNNPVNVTDPTGMLEDWVQDKGTGVISWDDKATSQATTAAGSTYLGKTGKEDVAASGGVEGYTITYNADKSMSASNVPTDHISVDGNKVYGFGGDPVAGSGSMKNDRGSGAMDADLPSRAEGAASDFMLIGNIAETFFKAVQSALSGISESNHNQATWGNRPAKERPRDTSQDTVISVSTQHYRKSIDSRGRPIVEEGARVTGDTTVRKKDVNKVRAQERAKNLSNFNNPK